MNEISDNKTIKALEYCANGNMCHSLCPYNKGGNDVFDIGECTTKLSEDALDLINRQKAEIEKAWDLLKKKSDENIEIQMLCDKQKAEIESLRKAYKQCAWERDVFLEDFNRLDANKITANAIKEFAERLEDKRIILAYGGREYIVVTEDDINNLLKEMTEGEK